MTTTTHRRQRSQWGGQFLVASELTRRGYTVSFTMGNNTPAADLLIGTPGGKAFWVDVKAVSSKNSWNVKSRHGYDNLYVIFVLLAPLPEAGKGREPDRFFVMTQEEVNQTNLSYAEKHPGGPSSNEGFTFPYVEAFEERWTSLPHAD